MTEAQLNIKRAERALDLTVVYRAAQDDLRDDPRPLDVEGVGTALVGMLADIQHLADKADLDWPVLVDMAEIHYTEEVQRQEEEGNDGS